MSAPEQPPPKPGMGGKAKAGIATATAIVALATGTLTLRDQLFPPDDDEPAVTTSGGAPDAADITNDAEAKVRATRVSDALKECASETGRDYQGCNTAGILGAIRVPIGSGMGMVSVEVTSPASFILTSRSESGNVFRLENTVQGEAVRTCTPNGNAGCPPDGRW